MARITPYLKQHEKPQGPGDARPTAIQVIRDQNLINSKAWKDRVVVITGCSPGGIGIETAKALHLTGAHVIGTLRDLGKSAEVVREIGSSGGTGKIDIVGMELGSLESVKKAAGEILEKSGGRLNVLVANAGVMFAPEGRTVEGFELHFGTNHLAHFYLFHFLKDALLSSAIANFSSRVIVVSSAAHRYGVIDLNDLNAEKKDYDPHAAYGQSKLANIHFANELDRRFKEHNIRALSLHPGGILTPLARHIDNIEAMLDDADLQSIMLNPAQGAATSVWAAVAAELEGVGGLYLDNVGESELVGPEAKYYEGGYDSRAFDPPTEKKLWEDSLRLVGLVE